MKKILPLNKLYLMDCLEGMREFPDKYFDLAIVDPNYTNEFSIPASGKCAIVNKSYNLNSLNQGKPTVEYFLELKRISINQIIWGVNYYDYYLGAGRIIWDKDNTGVYSDCELAYHSFSNVTRLFRYRWNGMLQQNMKNKESRIHPTQKPVQLYKWLLQNYAKSGDKIIDTHAGSCSSVIACIDGSFDWIAFEIDKDYYQSALKRINNHVKQTDMFNEKKAEYVQQKLI